MIIKLYQAIVKDNIIKLNHWSVYGYRNNGFLITKNSGKTIDYENIGLIECNKKFFIVESLTRKDDKMYWTMNLLE